MYSARMATENNRYTGMRLDAAALAVLAHPLRSRLLSTLRIDGPATATDLAAVLVTNTGATSYHLRKLESVGLVVDTDEGTGKRRLWRASTDSHQFEPSDFTGDANSEANLTWLVRDYARHHAQRFEDWLDVEQTWPVQWRDAVGWNDDFVVLTSEQAQAMTAEIDEVIARYRSAGHGDPDARRLSVARVVVPLDADNVPREVAR